MNKFKFPVCYYPTQVIFIDDDIQFLKGLRLSLNENLLYKFIDKPFEALRYLREEYTVESFLDHCLVNQEEEAAEHRLLDINIRAIHREMYNPHRFNEISVLIIDRAMPNMDGLTLCKHLNDLPFKKILLTGDADERLIIDSFNQGLFDKYISKSDPDFIEQLNNAISELQKAYFFEQSQIIFSSIISDLERPSILNESLFNDFFHKTLKELFPCEYYLMDNMGSYIFLDNNANPSWLIVRNEEYMDSYYYMAETDALPLNILTALKEKEKIPYFHTDDELLLPPEKWEPYLHAAQSLKGTKKFYYSLIKDPKAYSIGKVLSYNEFLETDSKSKGEKIIN